MAAQTIEDTKLLILVSTHVYSCSLESKQYGVNGCNCDHSYFSLKIVVI